MKLLLQCHSSDENYSAECDLAVIEIDEDYLKVLAARSAQVTDLFLVDNNLDEISYRDRRCCYHALSIHEQLTDEEQDRFDSVGYIKVSEGFTVPEEQRTECDRLFVGMSHDDEIYIYWAAYPKHTNTHITTTEITLNDLKEMSK